jgi:hypothetical protein
MKRKTQKQAPFVGQLLLEMPDGAQQKVKLPSAAGFEVGAVEVIECAYKGHTFRVPLVRCEGGWDLKVER